VYRKASTLWPFSLKENGTQQGFPLRSNGRIVPAHHCIIASALSNATGDTDTAPSNGLAKSAIDASATATTNVSANTWQ
jgi:hypothetical protein